MNAPRWSQRARADLKAIHDYREIPVHVWRVIYQLRSNAVFIVTLVHRRRTPAPEDLSA